jgi:hypothetical protein
VVLFFDQMDWIEQCEPTDAFDFNDIIVFFNQL